MAITYEWKLTSIKTKDVEDKANVVFQTYWTLTGTDEDGNTGTFSGATPLDLNSLKQGTFVAFEELTEEMVIGWIKSKVKDSYEEHILSVIQKNINTKKEKEISTTEFPWVKVNASTEPVNDTVPEIQDIQEVPEIQDIQDNESTN